MTIKINEVHVSILQSLDSGDEHSKKVGTSKENVKLNRFANITVCKYHYDVVNNACILQNMI